MSKYIDADRLKLEVEKHIEEVKDAGKRLTPNMGFFDAKLSGIYDVMAIIDSLQKEQPDEQPEYGYLSTEYVPGKKSMWSVGDVLAFYISTSNEEGEYTLGKIVDVEFDEYGWFYIFEDGSTSDEESLVEEGAYKKN